MSKPNSNKPGAASCMQCKMFVVLYDGVTGFVGVCKNHKAEHNEHVISRFHPACGVAVFDEKTANKIKEKMGK